MGPLAGRDVAGESGKCPRFAETGDGWYAGEGWYAGAGTSGGNLTSNGATGPSTGRVGAAAAKGLYAPTAAPNMPGAGRG